MDEGQILAALPICRREARRWRHVPIEQEELEGEAVVGLVKASKRFDEKVGTPFTAFALPYVRGAILDLVRGNARRDSMRNGTFAQVISIDQRFDAGGDNDVSHQVPDPRSTEDVVERLDMLRILGSIPWDERYVLIRTVVDGDEADVVAKELGVGRDRIYTLAHWGSRRLRVRLEKWAA